MEQHPLVLDEPVRRSAMKQSGISWPRAIDQRLDAMVGRADAAGENTNRRELAAAILFAANMRGPALGEVLRSYRQARVRDVILDEPLTGDVVYLDHHRPGPRRREPN